MGKLLITNTSEWDDQLRECYRNAGFQENVHLKCENTRITAYRKLKIDNENVFICEDDFAVSSGTLFYKEKFGQEALELLYNDAKDMTVTELRRNMLGTFVVAIKIKDTVRVFLDETHTYAFYYYYDGTRFLMTNTFYHIEKCVKQPIHGDAFLERCVRTGTIGLQTPFYNVLKLSAKQAAILHVRTGTFELMTCELNDYSCSFANREEAARCLFDRAEDISRVRSRYLHAPRLFLTGGVDSRLELSMFLHNGERVQVAYWMGSNCVTNGTEQDWEIVRHIAQSSGIPFTLCDVSETVDQSLSQITPQKCDRYGEYASIYACNSKWFEIFENMNGVDSLEFGFFGEVLRPMGILDSHYHEPYSIDCFIPDVYCRSNSEKYILSSESFYDFVKEEMTALGFSSSALTKDEAFKLFGMSRFDASFVRCNFANMFAYSFPILPHKSIMDANFAIPYAWRDGDWFSLKLTEMMWPDLLKLPYYSHHHAAIYNPSTGRLEFQNNPLRSLAKKAVYQMGLIGFYKKNLEWAFKRSNEDTAIFAVCKKTLKESKALAETSLQVIDTKNWSGYELPEMATIAACVAVLDSLKK